MADMLRILLFIATIVAGAPRSIAAESSSRLPELHYLCEDIPPSNYLQEGRLTGISVDLLKSMWRTMGESQRKIQVVPWARGYDAALNKPGHVLFSMSRTPERDTLFKWVGPIFSVRNVLLARSGNVRLPKTLAQAKALRIGTIKGDVVESFLLGAGFDPSRIEGVSSLAQNFEKLRRGRVDLLAHSENTLMEFIRTTKQDPRAYVIAMEFSHTENFYAFHRQVPDSVIERFQRALDGLRPEHARLLKRYGLSL